MASSNNGANKHFLAAIEQLKFYADTSPRSQIPPTIPKINHVSESNINTGSPKARRPSIGCIRKTQSVPDINKYLDDNITPYSFKLAVAYKEASMENIHQEAGNMEEKLSEEILANAKNLMKSKHFIKIADDLLKAAKEWKGVKEIVSQEIIKKKIDEYTISCLSLDIQAKCNAAARTLSANQRITTIRLLEKLNTDGIALKIIQFRMKKIKVALEQLTSLRRKKFDLGVEFEHGMLALNYYLNKLTAKQSLKEFFFLLEEIIRSNRGMWDIIKFAFGIDLNTRDYVLAILFELSIAASVFPNYNAIRVNLPNLGKRIKENLFDFYKFIYDRILMYNRIDIDILHIHSFQHRWPPSNHRGTWPDYSQSIKEVFKKLRIADFTRDPNIGKGITSLKINNEEIFNEKTKVKEDDSEFLFELFTKISNAAKAQQEPEQIIEQVKKVFFETGFKKKPGNDDIPWYELPAVQVLGLCTKKIWDSLVENHLVEKLPVLNDAKLFRAPDQEEIHCSIFMQTPSIFKIKMERHVDLFLEKKSFYSNLGEIDSDETPAGPGVASGDQEINRPGMHLRTSQNASTNKNSGQNQVAVHAPSANNVQIPELIDPFDVANTNPPVNTKPPVSFKVELTIEADLEKADIDKYSFKLRMLEPPKIDPMLPRELIIRLSFGFLKWLDHSEYLC